MKGARKQACKSIPWYKKELYPMTAKFRLTGLFLCINFVLVDVTTTVEHQKGHPHRRPTTDEYRVTSFTEHGCFTS